MHAVPGICPLGRASALLLSFRGTKDSGCKYICLNLNDVDIHNELNDGVLEFYILTLLVCITLLIIRVNNSICHCSHTLK